MIVLFTDFGVSRLYTGQVKAVLQRDAPGVPVIDLLDDVPPYRVQGAAYLLAALREAFPPGTVFFSVVDPGVGGARLPAAVRADGQWFVGPDNGLFEVVLRRSERQRAWHITWTPPRLAATFHGRDLFAPVAAALAQGAPVTGVECDPQDLRRPDWPEDLAEIIYVDTYGNAITGIRAAAVPAKATLSVSGMKIPRGRTFLDVPAGMLLCYENANGLIEVAANQDRAADALALRPGSAVVVEQV
jgi:S-adenosyl-L-methionine hydrolase (adenosine-forming)